MSNSENKKNVIVFVVDSLTYQRLGISGHNPSPSPNIDLFSQSGISLANCFTAGSPTEFSLPSMMTSTLPLDYGGYAYGIKGRPKTLAEVFGEYGYHTHFFKCNSFPSHWAYDRGYKKVYWFYDVGLFHLDIMGILRFYYDLSALAGDSLDKHAKNCAEYVKIIYSDLRSFCKEMGDSLTNDAMTPSLMLHDYDFFLIDQLAQEEITKIEIDPEKYIKDIWSNTGFASIGLEKLLSIINNRKRHAKTIGVDKYVRPLLALTGCSLQALTLLKRVSKTARHTCYSLFKAGQDLRYPSVGYLVDNLTLWIEKNRGQPFFTWLQPMDIHELNFTSFDVKNGESRVKREVKNLWKVYGKSMLNSHKYNGNLLYDYSVSYVDHQLGRLVNYLKKQKLWDNTILLVTADHGHTHVGWPVRNGAHVATHFFDELYHIPAIFMGGGLQQREIDDLCSSIDIAPTLLGLAGINAPVSFKGKDLNESVDSPAKYIIMEHMGKGLCDFNLKPIFVCVRSQTHKLVYVQPSPREQKKGYVREFYNLKNDPNEYDNLYPIVGSLEEADQMENVAKQRIGKLYHENGLR